MEIAKSGDAEVLHGYDAEGASTGVNVRQSDFVRAQKILTNASPSMVSFLDLDATNWSMLRDAMAKSRRFARMFSAGGTLDDTVSEILSWLDQPEDRKARIARKVRKARERIAAGKASMASKKRARKPASGARSRKPRTVGRLRKTRKVA